MAGRRRKWLIATILLAVVAALAWALLGRSGKMEVQLMFVGYTNRLLETQLLPGTTAASVRTLQAVVLVTNSGTVTVELYASVRQDNFVLTGTSIQYRDGFAAPRGPVPSRVLKPGKTMLIPVWTEDFTKAWSTEVYAQRRALSDRIYGKAWDTGNPTLQGIMIRWLPSPPETWTKLGPITNPPPDMEPVLDSRKPRPPRRPSPSLLDGGTYR